MRACWLLVLFLAGCLPLRSGVSAPASALVCAERTVTGLGYRVVARSGETGQGSFTAEKSALGPIGEPAVAVITASAWPESPERSRLLVRGRRYWERRAGGSPVPPVLDDHPDAPVGVGRDARPRARSVGRYPIEAGPVAGDVRLVEEQCGVGEAPPLRTAAQ